MIISVCTPLNSCKQNKKNVKFPKAIVFPVLDVWDKKLFVETTVSLSFEHLENTGAFAITASS